MKKNKNIQWRVSRRQDVRVGDLKIQPGEKGEGSLKWKRVWFLSNSLGQYATRVCVWGGGVGMG